MNDIVDKPAFDPSKPFQTTDEKPPFDPSKPFEPAAEERSWGSVASGALDNAWPSIKNLASDTIQPFVHPIDTAKAVGNLGMGAAEKLIPGGEYPHEKYANAVGEHFVKRYGGMENLKKTMADDPAGFLGDLSVVLSGGGAMAARAPGVVGQTARAVGTVGKALDPIMAPVNAVKAAGEAIPAILGTSTGVGPTAVKTAFSSGVKGGQAGEAFRENIRGATLPAEVVDDARGALRTLRQERSSDYVRDMAAVGKDMAVLDFTAIDKAMAAADKVKKFGTKELAPSTTKVRKEIADVIADWKASDPAQYHTAIGLDALKQRIGDIKDALQFNTPERLVAEKAYGAIRDTIVKQAPDYARIMKGYESASKQIDEVSRTLSLNPKASVDTALRKLQSAIRNNVNTNYGNRTELAKTLAQHGAPELMEKLSGQAMNSYVPRGLAGVAGLGEAYAAISHMNPLALAALPFASPRLVGEAAHGIGRAVGKVPKVLREVRVPSGPVRTAAQASRLTGEIPDADEYLRRTSQPPIVVNARRRAEGGRTPKLDYDVTALPKVDRHEMRASVPIGRDTELTGRAYAYPQTNGVGAPISPGNDWGATIGVRKGFEGGGIISGWVDGVADQDQPGQAEAARGVAARGVARGVQHRVPLGLLPSEGDAPAPPEAFPQKTWMMEPDLMAQQSGVLDLPHGAQLDDANRPFYPDTGRQIEMIKRPGLLPIAQTPDGPQFVMPKLLDLASNVMSPLAAGRVPMKAGEMVLGSGAVRTAKEQPWQVKGFEDASWYHGTTHEFDKFSKAKGNPENYLGKHPHFTSSPEDAAANYAGHGPDLTGRIERRAEELTSDVSHAYNTPEYNAAMEKAKARATQELAGPHSGAIIPAKMKLNKPASLVDSKPTWLDFNPVYDKAGDEIVKEAPALLKLHRSILAQGEKYGFDGQEVFNDVAEKAALYDGDVKASALHKAIKDSEELLDAHDAKGNIISSHVAAEAFKALGFDGIVMDAKQAFPNMKNIPDGTLHAVPLKRNTVKGKYGDQVLYSDTRNQVVGEVGHQIEKAAQPFYSTLERAVEGAKLQKGTPEQWAGYLRNQPGVKADEMDPLLGDWLKQQKGPITKEQLAEHIRNNKVEVKEVQKGGGDIMAGMSRREREKFDEAVQERVSHREDEWAMDKAREEAEAAVPLPDYELAGSDREGWHFVLDGKKGSYHHTQRGAEDAAIREAEKLVAEKRYEAKWAAFYNHAENAWQNTEHGGAGVDRALIEREVRNEMGLSGDGTKWGDYQLHGGENYRERLLTLPSANDRYIKFTDDMRAKYGDKPLGQMPMTDAERAYIDKQINAYGDGNADVFKSGHWDEPNVLAHVRMNDRMVEAPGDNAPRKSLHLEEIQSDWHQQGRKRGYQGEETPAQRVLSEERDRLASEVGRMSRDARLATSPEHAEWERRMERITEINEQIGQPYGNTRVPDAPFKKTWHELALKSALRDAVHGGYDRLSWTPGEAQAARYDLSKQIDELKWYRDGDGYRISAKKDGNIVAQQTALTPEKLTDTVGKDLADKIHKSDEQHGVMSGLDLKVGGHGMKGFYDEIVPKALEKLTKKYGVKVKQGRTKVTDMPTSEYDKYPAGHPYKEKNYPLVHYIDIPQALKDDILKHGQPLFARGGAVKAKAKRAVIETAQQIAAKSAIRRAMNAD